MQTLFPPNHPPPRTSTISQVEPGTPCPSAHPIPGRRAPSGLAQRRLACRSVTTNSTPAPAWEVAGEGISGRHPMQGPPPPGLRRSLPRLARGQGAGEGSRTCLLGQQVASPTRRPALRGPTCPGGEIPLRIPMPAQSGPGDTPAPPPGYIGSLPPSSFKGENRSCSPTAATLLANQPVQDRALHYRTLSQCRIGHCRAGQGRSSHKDSPAHRKFTEVNLSSRGPAPVKPAAQPVRIPRIYRRTRPRWRSGPA